MHAAEEQVARGPSVGYFAKRKQIRLHRLGQARLEARLAVTLDMKARRFHSVFQTHAVIEQVDRDLKDRRPDAVRATGAEPPYPCRRAQE